MTVTQVDVTNATFKANPFPFYAQLRAEAPVFPVTVPMPTKQRAWLITRYSDVQDVLKDARFAKNPRNAMSPEQLKRGPGYRQCSSLLSKICLTWTVLTTQGCGRSFTRHLRRA